RVSGPGIQRDLTPRGVCLTPVGGGPCGVQGGEGSESALQPSLELRAGGGVVGLIGVLVVDLPADDVGIVAEALGETRDDIATKLAIERARVGELAAPAVLGAPAVGPDAQYLGVAARQPGGRRIGWRADHHRDVVSL